MKAKIGIIGGSGFYSLAQDLEEIKVETPYGSPSGNLSVGRIAQAQVAFLPRHGKEHEAPPHKINYRANIWALKSLGVKETVTVTAAGSLKKDIFPGDFVILDQFVDRTRERIDTFYDGPITTHVSMADPYCLRLAKHASRIGKKLRLSMHSHGTVVVIQGPRFSSRAESAWFTKMGWDVVNMTQYPEVTLARELGMCYCAIALVTDYDVGLVAEGAKPVRAVDFLKVFSDNIKKAQNLVLEMIKTWPKKTCECSKALIGARVG